MLQQQVKPEQSSTKELYHQTSPSHQYMNYIIERKGSIYTLVKYFQPWRPVVSQNSLNIILIYPSDFLLLLLLYFSLSWIPVLLSVKLHEDPVINPQHKRQGLGGLTFSDIICLLVGDTINS